MDKVSIYWGVRQFFIDRAENERIPIAPYYGQLRNVEVTNTVYFEYFNRRLFTISVTDQAARERALISDFRINDDVFEMLTIYIDKRDVNYEELWIARRQWIEAGDCG